MYLSHIFAEGQYAFPVNMQILNLHTIFTKNEHSPIDIANKEDYNIVKDKKRIAQPVVQMTVRHMHCRFLLYNILGKQKGSVQNG